MASFRTAETSREALAECMVGRPVQAVERPPLAPGGTLLRIAGADVPGRHGRPGLDGADLEIRAREIVGIAGVSGNGQSELLEAIAGIRPARSGVVTIDGTRIDLAAARRDPAGARPRVPPHRGSETSRPHRPPPWPEASVRRL